MPPSHVGLSMAFWVLLLAQTTWTWWCESVTLICSRFFGPEIWTRQSRGLFPVPWWLRTQLGRLGWLGVTRTSGGWTAGAGSWLASMLLSFLACLMLRLKDRLLTSTPRHGLSVWQGLPHSTVAGFQENVYWEQFKSKSSKIVGGSWTTSSDPALVVTQHHFCLVVLFAFVKIFLTWTFFKVFIEFASALFLLCVVVPWPWGMREPCSLTRDRTCTPSIARWSPSHWTTRKVPALLFS